MTEESTTPDLEELNRRTVEAVNRRDFDAMMNFVAPHAVWDARRAGVRLEGREAIRGFLGRALA
jgi:ketosteroid isomerase-like protein